MLMIYALSARENIETSNEDGPEEGSNGDDDGVDLEILS